MPIAGTKNGKVASQRMMTDGAIPLRSAANSVKFWGRQKAPLLYFSPFQGEVK